MFSTIAGSSFIKYRKVIIDGDFLIDNPTENEEVESDFLMTANDTFTFSISNPTEDAEVGSNFKIEI
jgi:hypothetical protein